MTLNAQDRVARRAAAQAARRAVRQADVPDALSALDLDDGPESPVAEADEPVGPADVSDATSANLSARRAAQSRSIDLPQTDPAQSRGLAAMPADRSREITTRDLVMPRIAISQNTSKVAVLHAQTRGKEGVPLGNWYHSTTGQDLGEQITFIPTDMTKSMSRFIMGQGLVCRSFDLVKGEGDPGILCEGTQQEIDSLPEDERGCEYRLWKKDPKTGQRVKPPCGLNYNFPGLVVVDPENPGSSPILQGLIQFRSTGIPAAKNLITIVSMLGEGVWPNVLITLSTKALSGAMGPYYVPVTEYLDLTSAPEWAKVARRAHALSRTVRGADLRASVEYDPDASV